MAERKQYRDKNFTLPEKKFHKFSERVLLPNNRKIELLYKTMCYELLECYTLLENPSEEYINNYVKELRKQGYKVKAFGFKDKYQDLHIGYYALYDVKNTTIEERLDIVQKILDTVFHVKEGLITCGDFINQKMENNIIKSTTKKLYSPESILLEQLGSYLIAGEDENILSESKIQYYEKKNNNFETTETIDKVKKFDYHIHRNQEIKESKSRWKNSKTKRLNKIYSFDNHHEKESERVFFDRLINLELEFTEKWVLVDSDNILEFEGKFYQISQECYERDKKYREYTYKNEYEFDKVLVLKQNGHIYFFSQDIYEITENVRSVKANGKKKK